MVDVITDSASYYDAGINQYQVSLDAAKIAALNSIRDMASDISGIFDIALRDAKVYVDDNPLNYFIDSTNFRDAVTTLTEGANTYLTNAYNKFTFSYNNARQNIQTDFNSALTRATMAYNNYINAVVFNDPNLSTVSANAASRIDEITNSVVGSVTDAFNGVDGTVNQSQVDASNGVSEYIDDVVSNRPLLRIVGQVNYPLDIVRDGFNDFSLDAQNIGSKEWSGWLGVKIADEYKKVFEGSDGSVVYVIKPSEQGHIKATIKVPKVLYATDKDTGEKVPRNLGKKLNVTLVIYTRTEE